MNDESILIDLKGCSFSVELLILFGVILALAIPLSILAHTANRNRASAIALHILILGGAGIFLLVAGGLWVAGSAIDDPQIQAEAIDAIVPVLVFAGIAAALPVIPQVRRLLARLIPINPDSYADMTGLSVILVSLIMFATSFSGGTDSDSAGVSINEFDLIIQAVALTVIAAFSVGLFIKRGIPETVRRLGLVVPTVRQVLISIGLVIPLFIVSATAGVLTQEFQPELLDNIDGQMDTALGDLANVQGAAAIGLAAGISEEALFRGAMLPVFGLIFTSAIFALIHVQYGLSFVLAGVFLMGIVLGIQRKRMNTTSCVITHGLYNFLAVLLPALVPEAIIFVSLL